MVFSWLRASQKNTPESIATDRTRGKIATWLSAFWRSDTLDENSQKALYRALISADVGVETTKYILDTIKKNNKDLNTPEAIHRALKETLLSLIPSAPYTPSHGQETLLIVGVNGVGKTTTCAKLAHHYQSLGKKVFLAAGDTFRAAAVEQLKAWGERLDIPVIAQHTGADSASVLFDAQTSALQKNGDLLIADTAGRMHNKENLMQELAKIRRVLQKQDPNAPHETWLVLDASIGQNSLVQASQFHAHTPLTGLVLTKMDGSAKGGIVFAISQQLGIPIHFIGIGESKEDLVPFNPERFVNALLEPIENTSQAS